MKKIIQIIMLLVLAVGISTFSEEASASTAKEKVYREYSLPTEVKKFPIKLTNGLTVATAKVNGKTVPVIKKENTTVWQGKALATNSKIRFTVTKNNDTFFYYNQTVSGTSVLELIGINKAGKMFYNEKLDDEGLLKVDFLASNRLEVAVDVGYSSFASGFFLIYKDGKVEELNYFDKTFADLAKKGQLKWTTGAIGTTYKNLQPKVSYLNGKADFGEIEMYHTWKLTYGFLDGKTYGKLESNQKVSMLLERKIIADPYEAKAALNQYLGYPIQDEGTYAAYKAGSYYLIANFEDGLVTLDLVNKTYASFYGL